jgi:C4-dicarboxylate transporter DctM subunit
VNVTLILVILLALLLTGTPISIALGMTVLTFLVLLSSFSIDTVDIVSQRLFTGLESFAIMAVPFFVLSGSFPPMAASRAESSVSRWRW